MYKHKNEEYINKKASQSLSLTSTSWEAVTACYMSANEASNIVKHSIKIICILYFHQPLFIRPSSDGTYYGMVRSVRPSGSPSVRPSFPHFSPTCFDIFFWNFVYHFIFMHVRSSSNAINFRHFLQELCSFLTSNSYKYAVFRTFLLHALTYWVQIL